MLLAMQSTIGNSVRVLGPQRPINALLVDFQTVEIKATSMHVCRALNRLRQWGVWEVTYQPPMYLLPFCDACHASGGNLEAAHVTTLEVFRNAEVLIPCTMQSAVPTSQIPYCVLVLP